MTTQLTEQQFSEQMEIRDQISDLQITLMDVEDEKERNEIIDYAIKMLNDARR